MRRTNLPARALGALTLAYGLAVFVRPKVMLGPAGLTEDGTASALARMVGLRDAASGLAMTTAQSPVALRTAIGIRVASDVADTLVLGSILRGRPQQSKTIAITSGWALLCALSSLTVDYP